MQHLFTVKMTTEIVKTRLRLSARVIFKCWHLHFYCAALNAGHPCIECRAV